MTPFKVKEKKDSVDYYYDYPLKGYKSVKVSLYYSLGGMNYFTGKVDPRGIYLSVTPVTVNDMGGWISESYTMFSGFKHLVKEINRFSKKQLELCKDYLNWENSMVQTLILATADKEGR